MKQFSIKYDILYLFNKYDTWFFIDIDNNYYCITNDKVSCIYKSKKHFPHIVDSEYICFLSKKGDPYLRINDDLCIEKGKFKEDKKGEILLSQLGNDYTKTYVALQSHAYSTKDILEKFFDYQLEIDFNGLILIDKLTRRIYQFPMTGLFRVCRFSEDEMTLAVVYSKTIIDIDIDIDDI